MPILSERTSPSADGRSSISNKIEHPVKSCEAGAAKPQFNRVKVFFMTGTERKIFDLISVKKKIHLSEIAREMKLTSDYVRLICQSLASRGYFNISGNYCSISLEKKTKKKLGEEKKRTSKTPLVLNLKTVNKTIAQILKRAGYKDIETIAQTPFSIFLQKTGLKLSQAAKIFNEARKRVRKI